MTAVLPSARDVGSADLYTLTFVCLGNICRSPTAEVVLRERLVDAGLADRVNVRSLGTGDWHVGEPMDPRAAAELAAAGYDATRHRARTVTTEALEASDAVLAMDGANRGDLAGLMRRLGASDRLLMYRAFDPVIADQATAPDVPDPWYGGREGFAEVLAIVERTSDALVAALRKAVQPS